MANAIDSVRMADFAHARGEPPQASAVLRQQATDFKVVEQCAVTPAGTGEHLWLWVKKTGLTTPHVAELIAAAANVRARDVGFSGLKDRWAVTRQWFSLPWPLRHGDSLPFAADTTHAVGDTGAFHILRQQRHTRKLRRGTHAANDFVITLRDVSDVQGCIEADLTRVAAQGIPNYFGPQRFGHGGRNLALAQSLFNGQRLRRKQRGFAMSAARSYLFNHVLSARVAAGNWNAIVPGEAVILAGSHSIFSANDEDMTALEARAQAFDIHPSGPLPGKLDKAVLITGQAFALEDAVLSRHADLVTGLTAAGATAARRALRLPVSKLRWQWPDAATLVIEMTLPPGSYATCVLREFVTVSESSGHGADKRVNTPPVAAPAS